MEKVIPAASIPETLAEEGYAPLVLDQWDVPENQQYNCMAVGRRT
jgi:hypothetical protein